MTSLKNHPRTTLLALGVVLGVLGLSLVGWRVGASAAANSTIVYSGIQNRVTTVPDTGDFVFGGVNDGPIAHGLQAQSTSLVRFQFRGADDPFQIAGYPDPNFFGQPAALKLAEGALIGPGLPWSRGAWVVYITDASVTGGSVRIGPAEGWHPGAGQRPASVEGYVGVKGRGPCGTQYGWLHIRWEDTGGIYGPDKITIIDWAYETRCDTPIAAGAGAPPPTPGAALDFDRINDQVVIPDNSTQHFTTGFTVEAWIKPRTFNAWGRIVDKDQVGPQGWWFSTRNDGGLSFGLRSPTTYIDSTATKLSPNVWYHVAAVFDGNAQQLAIYINGVKDSLTASRSNNVVNFIGAPMRIGGRITGDEFFDGAIDEVRVWNTALCAAQILARKDCELTGTESGLVAYYKFNQGVAGGNNAGVTTATDSAAGGANNGTLNNFALNGSTSNWVAPGGVTSGVSCTTNPTCNQAPNCSGATIADQLADANCQATISGANVLGVTDPDGDTLTFTVSPTTLQLGANSVTITANDGKGGACSKTVTVTVKDTTPPQITSIPPNATYQCLSEVPAGNPSQATATDNCGTATITVADSQNGGAGSPASPLVITRLFIATDAKGNQGSATQTITVIDNTPPTLSVPAPITVNNAAGQCSAAVSFNVTASDNCSAVTPACSHASGAFFPIGTTTVTCTASDAAGNAASASFTVKVVDAQAPTITLTGAQLALWPPNHQYETINVAQLVASASDNCGSNLTAGVVIAKVSSDEAEDAAGGGDGATLNDIVIAPECKSVQLRAERQGSGNGRVYTITFKVKDAAGNVTTATAKVTVPKSQGNNGAAIDDGPVYTVNGNCL